MNLRPLIYFLNCDKTKNDREYLRINYEINETLLGVSDNLY